MKSQRKDKQNCVTLNLYSSNNLVAPSDFSYGSVWLLLFFFNTAHFSRAAIVALTYHLKTVLRLLLYHALMSLRVVNLFLTLLNQLGRQFVHWQIKLVEPGGGVCKRMKSLLYIVLLKISTVCSS